MKICVILTVLLTQVSFAQNKESDSYLLSRSEFAAPIYSDISQIHDLTFGSIVYDQATKKFYGIDSGGQSVTLGVSGSAVRSEVFVNTPNGFGDTNHSTVRHFTNTVKNTGTANSYSSSTSNGDTFTINEPGIYAVNYCFDSYSGGNIACYITLNSATLNASPAATEVLAVTTSSTTAGAGTCAAATLSLTTNDVLRAQASVANSTNPLTSFRVTKVSN